jgi:hypothetical protein
MTALPTDHLRYVSFPRRVLAQGFICALWLSGFLVFSNMITSEALAAPPWASESRIQTHGSIWLNLTSDGMLGSAPYFSDFSGGGGQHSALRWGATWPEADMRVLGIDRPPSLEFPAGSEVNYLEYALPLFGAVVGTDTLVSNCRDTWGLPWSEFLCNHPMVERTRMRGSSTFSSDAVADQEFSTSCADTAVIPGVNSPFDEFEHRPHRPIGVEVHQTSRSWETGYASQFVIVDMWFVNISSQPIRRAVIGVQAHPNPFYYGRYDDMIYNPDNTSGRIDSIRSASTDTTLPLGLIWMANRNGDPQEGRFDQTCPSGVLGLRVLRAPVGATPSFNWWVESASFGPGLGYVDGWGPRRVDSPHGYNGSLGRPVGDRGYYHFMTSHEIDYDQVKAGVDFSSRGWVRPPDDAGILMNAAFGHTIILVSYGPLPDIAPGDSVPLTYALIMGKDFHHDPLNFDRNFRLNDPSAYLANLNFSDLIQNALWAGWLFDNPGVDTDHDGYAGKYYVRNCEGARCDTVWYEGDGVPDWKGVDPPAGPAASLQMTSRPNGVTLHWNGAITETGKDLLSGQRDFEGYRVYSSRFNRADDYALIASWDKPDDFYRLAYDLAKNSWKRISYALTVGEWQRELGDSGFDPAAYDHPSLTNSYRDSVVDTIRDDLGAIVSLAARERLSYWEPEGPNQGDSYRDSDGRTYRNHIQRVAVRDTVIEGDTLQYGVYEFDIDKLNPTVALWFGVTTFDYGDYLRKVDPQETTPQNCAVYAFPLYSADVVVDSSMKVFVYPNPYKTLYTDAFGNTTSYFLQRYEGPGLSQMDERERRIWFANLPDTATIRIYSLDGDLIREIHHPDKFLSRYSSVVGWDLISRNTQAVTSGIYIWRVDSRLGTQLGKLVIIK